MPTPMHLSDEEMDAVLLAAPPVHPHQRDEFLRALAAELEQLSRRRNPAWCTAWPRTCRRPLSWRRTAKRRTPPSRDI
jgi:hypothetical protein